MSRPLAQKIAVVDIASLYPEFEVHVLHAGVETIARDPNALSSWAAELPDDVEVLFTTAATRIAPAMVDVVRSAHPRRYGVTARLVSALSTGRNP